MSTEEFSTTVAIAVPTATDSSDELDGWNADWVTSTEKRSFVPLCLVDVKSAIREQLFFEYDKNLRCSKTPYWRELHDTHVEKKREKKIRSAIISRDTNRKYKRWLEEAVATMESNIGKLERCAVLMAAEIREMHLRVRTVSEEINGSEDLCKRSLDVARQQPQQHNHIYGEVQENYSIENFTASEKPQWLADQDSDYEKLDELTFPSSACEDYSSGMHMKADDVLPEIHWNDLGLDKFSVSRPAPGA